MAELVPDKTGCYSITFQNFRNLDDDEIMTLSSKYGEVKGIHSPASNPSRKFIRYIEASAALSALEGLKSEFPDIKPPQNKSTSNFKENSINNTNFNSKNSKNSSSNSKNNSDSNMCEVSRNNQMALSPASSVISRTHVNEDRPPPLIRAPVAEYLLMFANLPSQWTKEDVYKLLEAVKTPEQMSEIKTTSKHQLKYCTLIYGVLDDMLHVKEQFDKKIIEGRQLIVVERNECIRKFVEYKHPIFSAGERFNNDILTNIILKD